MKKKIGEKGNKMDHYDIFISYKRKSLPTANNLYYRLTTRGYSTFFDLEEMRRDNFNVQLLNYIENAKDVFVILEEGSLDGCKKENWEEEDWFCHEIAFALEKGKNIIPILLGDYKMPREDFFPDKLKELSLKHSPDFSFSFFDAYLDKLIEKKFITAEAHVQNKATSIFKFYSNENCQVFKEGKLVCCLEGMSEEPFYLPVPRKGDFRFKYVNDFTSECQLVDIYIDANEEKNVVINWDDCKKHTTEQKTTVQKKVGDGNNADKRTRTVTILGDTTWYAIKQPNIKIFANNIQVGSVPYKGRTDLKLMKEKVVLVFKLLFFHSEYVIPSDFEGIIQLSTNRLTGKISAEFV